MAKGRSQSNSVKKIYGNAQDLTSMVFGYDLSTADGKSAVDNLLSSYQTQSGGGYVVEQGVAVKKAPSMTFDSDRFFADMDLMLGFGEGDFEGISIANLDIKKNKSLIEQQINKNVYRNSAGNVIETNLKYDDNGNLVRTKGPIDTTEYQEKAYKQHEKAINEAAINYEKDTRQAIKDANEARKPHNKASIEDIRKTPDLLLDIPEGKQRELADRAMYGLGSKKEVYPSAIAANMKNKTALDSFSAKTLADNDFLFKIDASDDVITSVYNNVNNKKWQDAYISKKYNNGAYNSAFDFKAKRASDLTADQMDLLRENFRENELKNFNNAFDTITEKEVVTGGVKGRPIKTTEEVRSFSAAGARRNYMKNEIFGGLDPTSKEFSDAVDRAISNVPDGATTGKQVDALMAYKDYAKKAYKQADTTRVMKAKDFMAENFGKADANAAHKLLKNELKGLGHDGIKASSKLKGLKVAGGIAAGLTALWAAGEIWDE